MHKGALGFFAFYTRSAIFQKFILVLGLNFIVPDTIHSTLNIY